MNEDTAIIVRGISFDIADVKNCFKDYSNNIVFSTWKGNENKFEPTDKVAFSEPPPVDGPNSYIMQRTTALAGFNLAEGLGYKNAILVRFDTLFKPADKVIELFDFNKLNFLCWHNHGIGYLVDYVMAGKIEYLKTLWNTFGSYPSQVPEQILTYKYIHELSDKVEAKFILSELNDSRDIIWKKYNISLSKYQHHPPYNQMAGGINASNRAQLLNYIK